VSALETQLENIKSVQDQLTNLKTLRSALEGATNRELLCRQMRDVENSIKEVSNSYRSLDIEPVEADTMIFVPYNEASVSLGTLYANKNPSEILGRVPEYIFQNKKVELRILAKNKQGQNCTKGGDTVRVELKFFTGNVTVAEIQDHKDGSYTASFTSTEVGKARVLVFVNGQHISRSPYSIFVSRNYEELAQPNPNKVVRDKMSGVWGIAFRQDGVWAVTNNSNHRAYVLNCQNQVEKTIGESGSNNGQFMNPRGITFDTKNNLYIVDSGNHRVQKFDGKRGYTYLLQFGGGSGEGKLNHPYGITTHNGRVYVADQGNHQIAIFQCDNGKFCSNIASSHHLSQPYDVVVNAQNNLLVADYKNHCILTFTLEGHYIGKFGTQGSASSLTTDVNGFILVVENSNRRVSIFDHLGNFIHSFGSGGTSTGPFSCPNGIALGSNGSIYVTDSSNCTVQVYTNY